jgi:hypothetical protein
MAKGVEIGMGGKKGRGREKGGLRYKWGFGMGTGRYGSVMRGSV